MIFKLKMTMRVSLMVKVRVFPLFYSFCLVLKTGRYYWMKEELIHSFVCNGFEARNEPIASSPWRSKF